jgi:polysaccharide biosynthesis protein PslJ
VRAVVGAADRGPVVSAGLVLGALGVVTLTVFSGAGVTLVAPVVGIAVLFIVSYRRLLSWPALTMGLVLLILIVPIKRYTIPGNLPFQLEPYRIYVAMVALMWIGALLVDPRVRFRKSGLETPLFLFCAAALGSVIFNEARITKLDVHTEVTKQLTFFASFVVVFYFIVSVIRSYEQIDRVLQTIVAGGAIVALFAVIESRTGFNIFDHLNKVVPVLKPVVEAPVVDTIQRGGKTRVFGSAQGPIALGAAFAFLLPLGVYLANRASKYWWAAVGLLTFGALATVSRTSILMLVVILVVFAWLRPTQVKRFWPALLPGLVMVHFLLPGTIGTLRASFFPQGGLIAQQSDRAGTRGSGRIADLGPALDEFSETPVFGQGFGSRLTGRERQNAHILDDQWLKTLLETGLVGAFAWLWLYVRSVRRLARKAKEDHSERGLMYVAFAASVASFAFGMVLYDAFSFIQVTFLLFIVLGLGSAALAAAERETARPS